MTVSRKASYGIEVLGALILPLVLCFICYASLLGRITDQEIRNEILESEQARLDRLVKEVHELENAKRRLLDRMAVYEQVRHRATLVVPILNVLSRYVSDDLTITAVEYSIDRPEEPELRITGEAAAMESIEKFKEKWKPSLQFGVDEHYPTRIEDVHDSGRKKFEIRILQSDIDRILDTVGHGFMEEQPG